MCSRRLRALAMAVGLLVSVSAAGCGNRSWTVKPHQRELLADRIMRISPNAQERAAEQHVLVNREGAIGGSGPAGGGCGCN